MAVEKITISAGLTAAERRMIQRTLDQETAVPVKFAGEQILVGFGPETAEDNVWDMLYRQGLRRPQPAEVQGRQYSAAPLIPKLL